MMNNSTIEALKAMRFSAMAAEFERQLGDPAAYSMLGFEERFALMVDAEWNRRQQNRLARCIREAHFAAPGAMIEDIEYHEDRRLDKTQILRFATCKYIEDGHHIILKGASGSGKTFLACALGNAACRKYKSVRYIRLPELLEELSLAQASGELKKLIKSYRKYDLLILDGDNLLKIILHPDMALKINQAMPAPYHPPRTPNREYDAIDVLLDRPVILNYQCDLLKLSDITPMPGGFRGSPIMLCFDYQAQTVQGIVGPSKINCKTQKKSPRVSRSLGTRGLRDFDENESKCMSMLASGEISQWFS